MIITITGMFPPLIKYYETVEDEDETAEKDGN